MAEAVAAPAPAAVEAPKVDAGKAEAPKPAGQMFKINGKDWSESDLAQRIQKAEGLEKRVADADRYERAFTNLTSKMEDPEQFVALLDLPEFKYDEDKQAALVQKMLGSKKPKLVAAVKQWLWENEVEPGTLTEEQRKLRDLEKENNRFKTEAQKAEDIRKAEELRVESEKIWNDYRVKIGAGIKAEKLPETEGMVARIARKASLYRRSGQPADIPAAIQMVKAELQAEYLQNMGTATDEEILNLLPEEVLKKINSAYVNKLKAATKGTDPEKIETGDHPFKRQTKQEKSSKDNKEFWKNVGRGMFAA